MTTEIIIFEAPKIVKAELRLYYDEFGHVLYYTTEKLDGNFIIVDSQTFAECRYDIRVVDGTIVRDKNFIMVEKLVPSLEGTSTYSKDISIIVDENYPDIKFWSLKVYEYRT